MPRGNKKMYLNSPFVVKEPVEPEVNKAIISHCLAMFNRTPPDLNNPDEVRDAINFYFSDCIEHGIRPGNMGLYNALDLDLNQVRRLINGICKSINGKRINNTSIEYIKRATKVLSEFREGLGSHGQLNPATLIFWQKNYDNLTDVQQVEISPGTIPQASKSPEEIAAEIASDLPDDMDVIDV